mgnify:CR=1 FL=1
MLTSLLRAAAGRPGSTNRSVPSHVQVLPLGAVVGGLTPAAAAHLGLPEGLPVAQGGAGEAEPGEFCTGVCVVGLLGSTAASRLPVTTPRRLAGIDSTRQGVISGQLDTLTCLSACLRACL